MDHSFKAETTFGDLEVDERYQKLKRSLKLAMLKANHRGISEEEIDAPVSLPGLSSINGDGFNSSCTTLSRASLKSMVLGSSNNLRNLLLKKSNYNTNQNQIATSSVKQYDIEHSDDIDRLIMPPPETLTVCHTSKKPTNTLANCENAAPILNSSVQSSAANTFSSKSTSTRISCNTNGDREHSRTDRVFSKWKVMLDKQLELRVKGTLKCGSRAYSKPIVRRYNAKYVESKFKYKYYLEGNIFDERNDLPDYIRGKFYNGFPDDWENVYQVWRTYFTQGCPVTFHWPTPITDSDDDLISEVTDLTYACKNRNKVASTAEHYKSVKNTEGLEESIAKSLKEKKQYHDRSDQQSNKDKNSTFLKPNSEFREDVVSVAQTKLVDIEDNNQLDPNLSFEFAIRKIRYLKDFLQEDQMNIIINNLEHKNCSPIYVNKVLEILDDLDFILTYRTNCDENSVVPASCETSKSEVTPQHILVRNGNRANIDKREDKATGRKNYIYSNDLKHGNTSNYSSNSNKSECDNNDSDKSENEIYFGVPKVSFEQVLKTREVLGKTYKRRDRKKKLHTDLRKHAANARNDTESVKYKSVPNPISNSTKDLLSESCVSITEDEVEAINVRKSHETALVHKQQGTRQQTILSCHQKNGRNFDMFKKSKPEKHTEDVRCYSPPKIQRSNEYTSVFVQEKQNFPHEIQTNARFFPDIDYTAVPDFGATNGDTYMKKPIESTTVVSRVNSGQEGVNTESDNLPKSSHVSRKRELVAETKTEETEKLKPTIISSIPVNLNLKICNTNSRSEHNSDVSIVVDDQRTNIRPTEASPRKKPVSPTAVSTNDIRPKTTNNGKKEIRSMTSDKRETNSTGSTLTKSVTNQNGHLTSNKKETNGINSISTKSVTNQNRPSKNVETGLNSTKMLTAWLPKVMCYPRAKNGLGLIFEGKLLNEAGHVAHRKFSTSVVLKRLSAKLIETVDHKLYELCGSFNDTKHNFPKELARLCRNGCPTKIEEFCLVWKTLLNDDVQKVTEILHETSVDLLNTAVSSRGRKLLPPLCYWTGERISLKDNNLIYNPGNSSDSLISLNERSKTVSSIEEKEKSRTDSKKPSKQDVNRQQLSPKSNKNPDEERPGQPKKVEDEELEELLKENSCRTQSELAEALGVTQQTISKRLHKLGGIQKEGRWVLSLENKARRCDTAMSIAMPNYSFREKADMIFMYGRANGNGCEAARLYQESFPNRQIPSSKTFASLYQRLIETGSVERNTTGYIANRVVACTSDFEDATLDDTENPDVSSIDQQCSDHMTNEKSHSSGKASTIYKRKKSTRRSAINGKQRIAQQITFSQESTSSSEEEQESPPKRACSSRSNVNANAPLQDTNVKTQENKQTSSSSHDETSPTREPESPKITCIYLKSVRPEDFLSEDQASIV